MAAPPTPTATSTTSDGAVLNVLNKRLRALRKKQNRIIQMEESLSQGKTLNSEQLAVIKSKPDVLSRIDEVEKFRAPIAAAIEEEVSLALAKTQEDPVAESVDNVTANNVEGKNGNAAVEEVNAGDETERSSNVVKDLVNLMYIGSLFDVKQQGDFTSLMLTRTHERGCCLTYDYVTDDATDLLGERDLDLISALQGLMIARPGHSSLTHQNALEQCFEHAKKWVENSDQPIDSLSGVTYAALREKLNKIISSDYLTATPQMKGPGEFAASAAVANFGSFQVPLHENVVNAEVPVQVERSTEQYQETLQENPANYEEYQTTEPQPGSAEEFHKGEVAPENASEIISGQTDQEQQYQNSEGEQGFRNMEYKDQQYVNRRGQRGGGGRGGGGGRRGFSNGRGGRGNSRGNGPYQNGRNQYYDNYYPNNRNYYPRRGRGGAGGGGGGAGGGGYYSNSSGGQGNYSQENVEVTS